MGKYRDYLQRVYQTDFASFIPNYYKLFYRKDYKEHFCIACKECIEKQELYVMMWNRSGSFYTSMLPLCKECGEECAEMHKMEIGKERG